MSTSSSRRKSLPGRRLAGACILSNHWLLPALNIYCMLHQLNIRSLYLAFKINCQLHAIVSLARCVSASDSSSQCFASTRLSRGIREISSAALEQRKCSMTCKRAIYRQKSLLQMKWTLQMPLIHVLKQCASMAQLSRGIRESLIIGQNKQNRFLTS